MEVPARAKERNLAPQNDIQDVLVPVGQDRKLFLCAADELVHQTSLSPSRQIYQHYPGVEIRFTGNDSWIFMKTWFDRGRREIGVYVRRPKCLNVFAYDQVRIEIKKFLELRVDIFGDEESKICAEANIPVDREGLTMFRREQDE